MVLQIRNFQWETTLVIDRQPYCHHEAIRVVIVNATSHLHRLRIAYEIVDWSHYRYALMTRPDVSLTRLPRISKMCANMNTTYIISGDVERRYIFHNRDWDFGYLACDLSLFHSLTINNLTNITTPALPREFTGCWKDTCKRHWRYPYMENVIQRPGKRCDFTQS